MALGWPLPANVVDLITEYRLAICGRGNEKSLGLLAALARYDLPAKVDAEEKKRAQQRCILGAPFEPRERAWIQSYCDGDTDEECELLRALGPPAVSPHAVWRGEFTKAIARMWWRGVPIDPRFRQLAHDREAWSQLLGWIIDQHRAEFPVYDGNTLKADAYEAWLTENNIPVPRTPTGRPSISLEVLAALAREYPALAPFEEGRKMLGQLHELPLPICADNRLRALFAPCWTITPPPLTCAPSMLWAFSVRKAGKGVASAASTWVTVIGMAVPPNVVPVRLPVPVTVLPEPDCPDVRIVAALAPATVARLSAKAVSAVRSFMVSPLQW